MNFALSFGLLFLLFCLAAVGAYVLFNPREYNRYVKHLAAKQRWKEMQ